MKCDVCGVANQNKLCMACFRARTEAQLSGVCRCEALRKPGQDEKGKMFCKRCLVYAKQSKYGSHHTFGESGKRKSYLKLLITSKEIKQ